jgi:hypothetical protein
MKKKADSGKSLFPNSNRIISLSWAIPKGGSMFSEISLPQENS